MTAAPPPASVVAFSRWRRAAARLRAGRPMADWLGEGARREGGDGGERRLRRRRSRPASTPPAWSIRAGHRSGDSRSWPTAQFSALVSASSAPARLRRSLHHVRTCLGFLLDQVDIRLVRPWPRRWGWQYALLLLVPGPLLGVLGEVAHDQRSVATLNETGQLPASTPGLTSTCTCSPGPSFATFSTLPAGQHLAFPSYGFLEVCASF